MPRAALTAAQRQLQEDHDADAVLKRRIRATMSVLEMNCSGMATRLGMSAQTFYRRMQEPGTFTLREMRCFERLATKAGDMTGGMLSV